MRYLVLLLLSSFCLAEPCVVLKRAGTAEHAWSGIEYQYVSGSYPEGYKFRTNLRGRHVRELVKKGGTFAVVEPNYTIEQLQRATEQCSINVKTVAGK